MELKTELNNFKPINLEEIVQGGEKVPDNIRNSIFLYNKAIESLRSGSEDIAMIELKKATSMNPHFNEALNLLGICYSYVGEMDKAAEIFNKVLKAESNSVLAMNYMHRLGLSETTPVQKNKAGRKTPEQPGEPLKRIRTNKTSDIETQANRQLLISVAKIGAGLAAGLIISALIYFSLPKDEPIQTLPSQTEVETTVNEALEEAEEKYAALESKVQLLQQDKENLVSQADYYKAALKLYEIESLARDRKYTNAADMLLLMKTVEFKDTEKEKFDALYKTVMPQAAKSTYDQGYRFYNSRKYQDALKSLEKVQVYDAEFKRMDAVFYYMGRSCQFLQDSRSAVALFQKLIDNYPSSTYAKNAKIRINELTKIP